MSEIREAINAFPEDGAAEDRDKLTTEFRDVDSRWRAAVVVEESETTPYNGSDGEATEFRSLVKRASLGRMLAGIAR